MKGVLKVFLKLTENLSVGLLLFIVSIGFWSLGLLTWSDGAVGAIVASFLIGCVFFTGSYILIVMRINAIRKFKKEFGFLPPTTPEGRDVLQRNVDGLLGSAASTFLNKCKKEEDLKEKFKNLKQNPTHDSNNLITEVEFFENELPKVHKVLVDYKKHFWQLHAIARSNYLPCPFKVLKRVEDYKDVTYDVPTRHDDEADTARRDGGLDNGSSTGRKGGFGGTM